MSNNWNKVELTYHGVIYSKKNNKRIVTNPKTHKPLIISSELASQNEKEMVRQGAF